MILGHFFVIVVFCGLNSKADILPDLDYYYLDTVGTQPSGVIPQDSTDAQTIIDSKKSDEVVANILLHRDKIRRININKQITAKDKDHPLLPEKYWVQDRENPLTDLYFTLVYDENMVVCTYLRNFLQYYYSATEITIGLVLTKNMSGMIEAYDKRSFFFIEWHYKFKNARKDQSGIYENLLRVWVRQNRELNEKEELKPEIIKKDLDALTAEYNDGCWHEHRDQIELVLIKKSIKYSRAVISEFEKAHENRPMEKIIDECKDKHDLNKNLANAYSSLARYIKDRNQYMADIMRQYSDGKDYWGIWMMCIAVAAPEEWIKIDECFRKADNKNISLSKFILDKVTKEDQHTFSSMVSQILDVTNKGPSKPPTKPPTTPAPAPAPQPPSG